MEERVIAARNLGKRYHIGTRAQASLLGRVRSLFAGVPGARPVWAVSGVELDLRRGECLGLIGPNGAGKTTLLMLLAGLLEPTEGNVEVRGRVSPFFQIGSGLHAELSVLDNLRLAAALFGLSRPELERRFDAIVSFGGLEDYLYARLGELSSGFQSRVPFSVALHSDIDILLTDEVFAVGDAAFSARCLERMKVLMSGGATVVMASHSMELVEAFCPRALYLDRGVVLRDGPSAEVVAEYLSRPGN